RSRLIAFVFLPAIASAEGASGTWLSQTSEIEVDEARIVVRCTEEKRRAGCEVTSTYLLHNPTGGDVTTGGGVYGSNEADITLDGKSVRADGSVPPQLDALVDVNSGASPQMHSSGVPHSRTGFSITLPAGARGTLVMKGAMPPTRISDRYGDSAFVN